MSDIVDIKNFDRSEYEDLLGADLAENMDREYFGGFLSLSDEGEINGGIVWELRNVETDDDTRADIIFFSIPDKDTGLELLNEYTDRIADDEVVRSHVELWFPDDMTKELLEENGFSLKERENNNYLITVKDAAESGLKVPISHPEKIVPLSEIELIRFRQAVTEYLFSGKKGLYDDLAFMPKEWYEPEMSCCAILDGKIVGIHLIHILPSGVILPVVLYGSGADARLTVLHMLSHAVKEALRIYSADAKIIIKCVDSGATKFVNTVFPGKKGQLVTVGERSESL